MWDKRFDTPEYIYGTKPNNSLISVASQVPKGKILCLVEGEERNGTYSESLGYEVVA